MNLLIHALTFLLGLAFLIFVGRLLLGVIAPPRRSQPAAEWIPEAFLLGGGAACIITLPLSLLNIKTQIWMLLAVGGIVAGAAAAFKRQPEQGAALPWKKYEWPVLGIFALLLTANFLMVNAYPQFDIDMIGHILMKARIISDSSYAGAAYFHDPVFATAHNNYPPLTVFLHSFMSLLGLGSVADYQALNFITIFFLGLAVHTALRSRIGPLQSLAWCFILISTADYLRGQFLISSIDIYFSLALLLSALAFLETKPAAGSGENTLFSLLCACALLIKNDAVLFIGLITLGLWIKHRAFPARHLLILTVLAGPWMLYRMTLPDPDAGAELVLKHIGTYLQPGNFPLLVQTVASVLTHNLNGIFLISLCAWPFLFKHKDLRLLMGCVIATCAAYIFLIWCAIPVGIGDERPGLMRLWSQVYPLMLFITALALNAPAKQDQY